VSHKIKHLDALDPHAVPLPHGTEVTTGVARTGPDGVYIVPQGAVGRVVGLGPGESVSVAVVGVGEITYQRHELTPRKLGQARYALRRAEHESSLRRCVVLEATVGSQAWGLADEHSDVDVKGVFLLPFPWTLGLVDPPDTLNSPSNDWTAWELGKTIRQLLAGDPNTLEMLFVPDARASDPVGQDLLDHRDAFVSGAIYGSFGRYALSQVKKLGQSSRLAEHRTVLLGWLREEPGLDLDRVSLRLACRTTDEPCPRPDAILQAKQYVKQLCRSMCDQGLMPGSDFASLAAFAREKTADFDLPRELRPKNAYNLLRLVTGAVTWLRTGKPLVRVEGALRERLLAIKRGEVPLETVLGWTGDMAGELEDARAHSVLPERPDIATADRILREARKQAAWAWAAQAPGPWGTDAPEAPAAQWDDP
jgi:hypothetical protein